MIIYKQLTKKCQHFLLVNFASIIINFYEGLTTKRQTTLDRRQRTDDVGQIGKVRSRCHHMWQQLRLLQKFEVSVRHQDAHSGRLCLCNSFTQKQQTTYANLSVQSRTLVRRAKCKKNGKKRNTKKNHCQSHFNDKFQHTVTTHKSDEGNSTTHKGSE